MHAVSDMARTRQAVNLPMLFGPLFFAAMAAVAPSRRLDGTQKRPESGGTTAEQRAARAALGACVLSGVACLSLAPHQEPRFLLPLTLPLALLFGSSVCATEPATPGRVRPGPDAPRAFGWRGAWGLSCRWLLFNLAMLLFFAGAHQSGVTRVLIWLAGRGGGDEGFAGGLTRGDAVVFFRTYMPPVGSLLLAPTAAPGCLPPEGPRPRSLPLPVAAQSWSRWLQDTMQDMVQDAMDVTGLGGSGQESGSSLPRWLAQVAGYGEGGDADAGGDAGAGAGAGAGAARVGWGVCTGWRAVDLGGATPAELEAALQASPPPSPVLTGHASSLFPY